LARSKASEIEAKKQNVKGRAESGGVGETVGGKQKPLPAPTGKPAAIGVKKNGEGKPDANGGEDRIALPRRY
jgi:hypothetical protein